MIGLLVRISGWLAIALTAATPGEMQLVIASEMRLMGTIALLGNVPTGSGICSGMPTATADGPSDGAASSPVEFVTVITHVPRGISMRSPSRRRSQLARRNAFCSCSNSFAATSSEH